jgi:hypothetical protein
MLVAIFAFAAGRIFLTIGVVVFGILVLVLPNGALLIAGAIVLGVVYMLTKSGVGSVSVSITKGDGDGDINVNL